MIIFLIHNVGFKIKSENSYNIRFSLDQLKTDHNIDVNFVCQYLNDNNPLLLFDGRNKNNYSVHAQVDEINEQSKIYLFPSFNKNNAKGQTYDDGEQFLLKTICISVLTLDYHENKII